MSGLQADIAIYQAQLQRGNIQNAYKGILTFLSCFRTYLSEKHPTHRSGALYAGYMDMSYFSHTPEDIVKRKLKIALVYLHESGSFEAWLCGNNRQIQINMITELSNRELGRFHLSKPLPGVDSIVECSLETKPNFDRPEWLMNELENRLMVFIQEIRDIVA
ncbi:MAG: hypothetical protein WC339_03450 [Candidatus Izemoplasmatales bacterium]|jgi:hypothetical protein